MSNSSHEAHGLGARIRAARVAAEFTQEVLAERSELSIATISRIERELFEPSLTTVVRISHALGVELAELVTPADRRNLVAGSLEKRICAEAHALDARERRIVLDLARSLRRHRS